MELVTTNKLNENDVHKAQVNYSTKIQIRDKEVDLTCLLVRFFFHSFMSFSCSDTLNNPAAPDARNSQDAALKAGDDITLPASVEKTNERFVTETEC